MIKASQLGLARQLSEKVSNLEEDLEVFKEATQFTVECEVGAGTLAQKYAHGRMVVEADLIQAVLVKALTMRLNLLKTELKALGVEID